MKQLKNQKSGDTDELENEDGEDLFAEIGWDINIFYLLSFFWKKYIYRNLF